MCRYSVPTDLDVMEQNVNFSLYSELRSKYNKYKFVVFLPSRKNLNKNDTAYKGTEKALYAIQRIVNDGHNIRCVSTTHGTDPNEFIDKIKELKLTKYFDFVDPMPFYNLSSYLKQPNFVIINDVGFKKSHLTVLEEKQYLLVEY